MAKPLDQLTEVSGLPNMSLRVAPFSVGAHPGVMPGTFVILRFPVNGDGRESEPVTVYKDGFTGALYLDKPQEVEIYAQAFGSHEELPEKASQITECDRIPRCGRS